MIVSSFKCADIIFDIHDIDRVSKGNSLYQYFVTPQQTIKIEAWLIRNNKDKVKTKEEMEYLIKENLIGTYV